MKLLIIFLFVVSCGQRRPVSPVNGFAPEQDVETADVSGVEAQTQKEQQEALEQRPPVATSTVSEETLPDQVGTPVADASGVTDAPQNEEQDPQVEVPEVENKEEDVTPGLELDGQDSDVSGEAANENNDDNEDASNDSANEGSSEEDVETSEEENEEEVVAVVPSGSFAIVGGLYTSDRTPDLQMDAQNATEMLITNQENCSNGAWTSYSANVAGWQIEQFNKTATVYVKFRSSTGDESSCLSDSILHDDIAPTDMTIDANIVTSRGQVTLEGSWSASQDSGSGFSHYEVSLGTSQGAYDVKGWENQTSLGVAFKDLTFINQASYFLEVRAKDLAGNVSAVVYKELKYIGPYAEQGTQTSATKSVATGRNLHECFIIEGQVKCTGSEGLLGGGVSVNGEQLVTLNLGANRTAFEVVAGARHTCARLDDDSVKCWGENEEGQLGGTLQGNYVDVDLGEGRTAKQLSAGWYFTCALLDDGGVKCWGNNERGQLGQGHTSSIGTSDSDMGEDLPAIDFGSLKAKQVAAGDRHACAVFEGGGVKCWGFNSSGQLGLGHETQKGDQAGEMQSLPFVDLGSGAQAMSVTVGNFHSCALLTDQNLKCWGHAYTGSSVAIGNQSSEMGDNLPIVNLGSGRTVVAVEAKSSSTCAILDNGDLKCWGTNYSGQLGQGHEETIGNDADEVGDQIAVTDLGSGVQAVEVSLGSIHACALLDSGDFKCWGFSYGGGEPGEMGDNLPIVNR